MNLGFFILMKSSSSAALGVHLNLINVAVMKLFSFQTFHHPNFDNLKKDDAISHPINM